MDYYDFYRFRKDVLTQSEDYRLIAVRIKIRSCQETILIREYCDHKGYWYEQTRTQFTQKELQAIKELT
jgi:hypothetical protein